MKPLKAIPDRWLEYNACGRVIEGTRLICFKVPLRKEVQVKEPSITQLWDIPAVLAEIPRLSAVIDLTNTARYYNPHEFLAEKVLHKKILMPGRMIPPESKVKEFMDAVDEFSGRDCDSLVGVHCTHGLNRTGYMVCRYMRDRLGIAGPEAIKRFETARGYKIERDIYINGILNNNAAPEHEGKKRDHSTNEINPFEKNPNKVYDEVPDVVNHPNEYNHNRGGRFNNMLPRNRQFEATRGRRAHYNDKPYARQSSIANRDHMRSTYNQGPSRSFNNDGFNRQNNSSRNNDDRPSHSRNEGNHFENSHNNAFDEVAGVDDQPNEYNHRRGGIRRFNNIPPRNRQFEPNRDRRGHYNDTNQPSFANRGHSRYNDRFTPYHKRGSNNFRGNDRRNYNDRYEGGISSNSERNTDNDWRKRGNRSSDNKSTWRNSEPDRSQNSDSKTDHS